MAELEPETARCWVSGADENGTCVVSIGGELDISTVEDTREQVDEFLGDATEILFDLRELQFMDSSGIGLLLQVANRLGTSVPLRNVSPLIARIIEVTGVQEVLRITP
jgi:anti-anti-sigma factor